MTENQTVVDAPAPAMSRPRKGAFEYVFPAIRGVQAGHEYYVTMCPLRLIPRLFTFDEEELPAEMRAQRTLNKSRVPDIARYVLDNPKDYVFSALTASVDADVVFEAADGGGPNDRVGTLTIPMSARFVINDGQHRRAAIQQALAENPELGDESIAIVMYLDVGLARCQQMFADLNRYAIRPAKSIGVLYDHRDEMSAITRMVISNSDLLRDLTETESSNLAQRSRKLFTLSAFYAATKALLEGMGEQPSDRRVELASRYWELVGDQFPEWGQVRARDITAGEVRQDFIHTHGIVLHALGKVGHTVIERKRATWSPTLRKLRDLDWHRSNATTWEGRAMIGGRVSKSAANVLLTSSIIRSTLGLSLPPDEQRAEDAFQGGEK